MGVQADEGLDPSVAAHIVCQKCGIHNWLFEPELTEIIKRYAASACQPIEQVTNHMILSWESYIHALRMNSLSYGSDDPRRFFRGANWFNEDYWPWKPSTPATREPGIYRG